MTVTKAVAVAALALEAIPVPSHSAHGMCTSYLCAYSLGPWHVHPLPLCPLTRPMACAPPTPVGPRRGAVSSQREQASCSSRPAFIEVPFSLGSYSLGCSCATSPPIQPRIHTPEEEIAYGPAAWLWDYLRR